MTSAQTDASLFCPAVEELRNGEASLANVARKFCHVDNELRFTLTIGKKCSDEMTQTFFCIIQLARQERRSSFLRTGRKSIKQVESEHLALHHMAAKQMLAYAQHLDVRSGPICVFVCGSEAIKSIHLDNCWSFQQRAGSIDAVCRTMLALQFSFDEINQLRTIVTLSDERQVGGGKLVYVEPQSFLPAKQFPAANALKQRQSGKERISCAEVLHSLNS